MTSAYDEIIELRAEVLAAAKLLKAEMDDNIELRTEVERLNKGIAPLRTRIAELEAKLEKVASSNWVADTPSVEDFARAALTAIEPEGTVVVKPGFEIEIKGKR